jgi:hypothetical protein
MRLRLNRFPSTPFGTWGVAMGPGGFPVCVTAERPWLDNRPNVSCIPKGLYKVKLQTHYGKTRHYPAYEVLDVPGRKDIELHIGAFPLEHSEGCILLGTGFRIIDGKNAVYESEKAYNYFMDFCENRFEELEIVEVTL